VNWLCGAPYCCDGYCSWKFDSVFLAWWSEDAWIFCNDVVAITICRAINCVELFFYVHLSSKTILFCRPWVSMWYILHLQATWIFLLGRVDVTLDFYQLVQQLFLFSMLGITP
jgi:hypothetical protein